MFDYEPRRGYVVWPRSFEKLPSDIRKIFHYLLCKATYDKRDSRDLERGQVKVTIDQLANDIDGLKISPKQVRNRVEKMVKMKLISYQPGSRGVPSIFTITGYDIHQNTKNYGNLLVNNKESKGKLKGSSLPNGINDLEDGKEPKGKLKGDNREAIGKPYKNIKHNGMEQNPDFLQKSTTTLLSKMQEFVEIRKANFPNEDARKYIPHKDDAGIVDELLKEFSENQILKNWEMFVLDPARVFYKSRPITFHLFKKAIYEEQAANKPRKNVIRDLIEKRR